jgi:hypothetical protein
MSPRLPPPDGGPPPAGGCPVGRPPGRPVGSFTPCFFRHLLRAVLTCLPPCAGLELETEDAGVALLELQPVNRAVMVRRSPAARRLTRRGGRKIGAWLGPGNEGPFWGRQARRSSGSRGWRTVSSSPDEPCDDVAANRHFPEGASRCAGCRCQANDPETGCLRSRAGRLGVFRGCLASDGEWKPDPECGALARPGVDANGALVRSHERCGDGQAKSRAAR